MSQSQSQIIGIDYIKSHIRDVRDFPKKGIMFRDITPALGDSRAFGAILDLFEEYARTKKPTRVLGIEARGFIIGAPLADRLNVGFVPVRKPGKLPWETVSQSYELEYGIDSIEMHSDGLHPEESVLIVDDLLATGGTALAACELVEQVGAKVVGVVALIDLAFLPWRTKLAKYPVETFIRYDSE